MHDQKNYFCRYRNLLRCINFIITNVQIYSEIDSLTLENILDRNRYEIYGNTLSFDKARTVGLISVLELVLCYSVVVISRHYINI